MELYNALVKAKQTNTVLSILLIATTLILVATSLIKIKNHESISDEQSQ